MYKALRKENIFFYLLEVVNKNTNYNYSSVCVCVYLPVCLPVCYPGSAITGHCGSVKNCTEEEQNCF